MPYARETAQPVVIDQDIPVAVEMWRPTSDVALRALIGVVAVLHAITCLVFLWIVYLGWHAVSELQDTVQQWGSIVGG